MTSPLPHVHILTHIREFTLERDLTVVRNVINLLVGAKIFEDIRKFILERNCTNAKTDTSYIHITGLRKQKIHTGEKYAIVSKGT